MLYCYSHANKANRVVVVVIAFRIFKIVQNINKAVHCSISSFLFGKNVFVSQI